MAEFFDLQGSCVTTLKKHGRGKEGKYFLFSSHEITDFTMCKMCLTTAFL